MNPLCSDREMQRRFIVKLFDPILGGIVKYNEFEKIVREMFASEADLME